MNNSGVSRVEVRKMAEDTTVVQQLVLLEVPPEPPKVQVPVVEGGKTVTWTVQQPELPLS